MEFHIEDFDLSDYYEEDSDDMDFPLMSARSRSSSGSSWETAPSSVNSTPPLKLRQSVLRARQTSSSSTASGSSLASTSLLTLDIDALLDEYFPADLDKHDGSDLHLSLDALPVTPRQDPERTPRPSNQHQFPSINADGGDSPTPTLPIRLNQCDAARQQFLSFPRPPPRLSYIHLCKEPKRFVPPTPPAVPVKSAQRSKSKRTNPPPTNPPKALLPSPPIAEKPPVPHRSPICIAPAAPASGKPILNKQQIVQPLSVKPPVAVFAKAHTYSSSVDSSSASSEDSFQWSASSNSSSTFTSPTLSQGACHSKNDSISSNGSLANLSSATFAAPNVGHGVSLTGSASTVMSPSSRSFSSPVTSTSDEWQAFDSPVWSSSLSLSGSPPSCEAPDYLSLPVAPRGRYRTASIASGQTVSTLTSSSPNSASTASVYAESQYTASSYAPSHYTVSHYEPSFYASSQYEAAAYPPPRSIKNKRSFANIGKLFTGLKKSTSSANLKPTIDEIPPMPTMSIHRY